MHRMMGLRASFGPQVIGRHFEFLGQKLGDGPMSTVELCRHKASQCFVALKSYSKAALVRHEKVDEAFSEKKALMQLDGHPLVLVLLATFQTEALLYFVLEFCPGGDLVDAMRREPGGRFSIARCWQTMKELFEVMDFIHAKGIAHRDIKAENILLGSDGRIRLSDFATAIFLTENASKKRRAFVGSAQYVAPEIIADGEPTVAVDIWGCGCVAYYIAFGRHAFLRDTDYLTWTAALKEPLTFPEALNDLRYVALLEECLRKDPAERPSASTVRGTLL